jgi:hypothetical protein
MTGNRYVTIYKGERQLPNTRGAKRGYFLKYRHMIK